ncbi:iron chelate uptake ABC transporter family permease subunit [Paenibacillus chartarius]|uniref:Iron chelate uptake ABC transporter family permease subunit n=1 Tax=Paenibacillus chartarius TaxID=747481 RepID=A0ABV6DU41_9BACL
MTFRAKLALLTAAALAAILLFMFIGVGRNWEYVLERRAWKIAAMLLTGGCIALSTIIFQTITNNRILTPNIIGMDATYMLAQTAVVYLFGSASRLLVDNEINFVLTLVLMLLFTGLLYRLMFKREGRHLYHLILVGIVLGTLLGSVTTFMQVLIDPNEFLVLQGRMFATYNQVQGKLIFVGAIVAGLVMLYFARYAKYLDVLSLGKEHAVNVGVDYPNVVKHLLIVIAVLVSVATALVGPMTFLGLLTANVTYQLMRTYRHSLLIPASILVSIIAMVGGQMIVERVFGLTVTLSVVINLIGGVYFLYLLLKENKA